MAQLANYVPVRKIGTSRRALTGRVRASEGGVLNFESSLERDWLMVLDFSRDVVAVREQPFTIAYDHKGSIRKYTPDMLAEHVTNSGLSAVVIYEVKYHDELETKWAELRPRFKALVNYCRTRGWRFKIVTEKQIRTPFLQNAKFLRRYRAIDTNEQVRLQLLYTFKALGETTPEALLVAAYWDEDARLRAIPQLWKLVAERDVLTDLSDPLTMSSCIWVNSNA